MKPKFPVPERHDLIATCNSHSYSHNSFPNSSQLPSSSSNSPVHRFTRFPLPSSLSLSPSSPKGKRIWSSKTREKIQRRACSLSARGAVTVSLGGKPAVEVTQEILLSRYENSFKIHHTTDAPIQKTEREERESELEKERLKWNSIA